VPGALVPATDTVIVVSPVLFLVVGANVAVTPEGSPDVPNVTVELKPPAAVRVTGEEYDSPAGTAIATEALVREKFFTVSVMFFE
jgi:hypothetical protein